MKSGAQSKAAIEEKQRTRFFWYRVRWEFARRNPDYIADWEEAQKKRKENPPPKFAIKRIETDDGWKEVSWEKWVLEKHGLAHMFHRMPDPKKTIEKIFRKPPHLPWFYDHKSKPVQAYWHSDKNGGLDHLRDGCYEKVLTIDIDFSKINSINALKRHVADLIDSSYEWYLVFSDQEDSARRIKKYKVDYDLLLQVGDWREKEKLTFREISKRLDPKKHKQNPESGEKLAQIYYKKYQKLVAGEYKDLNYP